MIALLTAREHQIMLLLGGGLSHKQIERSLFIAPSTLRNHISSIYQKTGVQTVVGLVVLALRLGWLTLDDLAATAV